MPLTRLPHWDTRAFHDFLLARADQPFAWGAQDCALFAADGVQAITEVDIATDFRGAYSDEAGAFEAIRRICGLAANVEPTVAHAAEYCAAQHGLVELRFPLMAQRGDLVVLEESGRLIAGLVHLSGRHIVAAGERGLKRLPITSLGRAWRV